MLEFGNLAAVDYDHAEELLRPMAAAVCRSGYLLV